MHARRKNGFDAAFASSLFYKIRQIHVFESLRYF